MIDLRLGDCLAIMPTLAAQSFDAIIADIPYGTTACKWDTVIPFAPMWENLKQLAKPKAAIVLFGSEPFSSLLRQSNIAQFRFDFVWVKNKATGAMTSDKRPMLSHEIISVFYGCQPTYNPQRVPRTQNELKRLSRNSMMNKHSAAIGGGNGSQQRDKMILRYPDTLIYCNCVFGRSGEKTIHPTQKPVALMEYLIRTYTNEGDAVLDFTMGSGTTMVACVNTKRNGTGIEKDAGYYAIAERRVKEAQAQMTMPQMV